MLNVNEVRGSSGRVSAPSPPSQTMDYGIPFKWKLFAAPDVGIDKDGFDRSSCPQVVVVGAGPIGLAIAAGLTRSGVRTLVLEADSSVCRSTRAGGISQKTFEVMNRVAPGSGDDMASVSLPVMGSESFFGERLILRQGISDYSDSKFPPNNYLPQWNIEDRLVTALGERPELAEIRWQSEVTGLRQDAEGAILEVTSPKGNYRIRAPWVVAADGGRSAVRKLLGLRMAGLAYEVTFTVVDAAIDGVQPPPVRKVWFDPEYLPGGLLLRHMLPDGLWRLDFQMPHGSNLDLVEDPERVAELIRAHLASIGHEAASVRPIWISSYKARAIMLDEFRHDHVLFAGDAAHIVPIFGGFGLNSGIDDADNLQWKLALVAKGDAPETLLDTYSDERKFSIRTSLDLVTRAAEFMTPTSVASEQLRRAALTLAAEGNALAAGLGRHRPFRSISYAESMICRPDTDCFAGGPRGGEAIPRGFLEGGAAPVYLPDLVGGGFTIIIFEPDEGSLADFVRACASMAEQRRTIANIVFVDGESGGVTSPKLLCLKERGGYLRKQFDASGQGGVYLVRPDAIVAARWRAPCVEDVEHALDLMTGQIIDSAISSGAAS